MRLANRLAGLCLLAAMVVASSTVTRGAAPVRPASDRVVVMISVDGLAAPYLDDPKADMPNLRALAKEGARASKALGADPALVPRPTNCACAYAASCD